jgi:TPR repeat protein
VASTLADAFFASLRVDVCIAARARQKAWCEAGKAASCFKLGLMWGNGVGGPASQKEARTWVDRACKGGHEEACEFLPQMRLGEQASPTRD